MMLLTRLQVSAVETMYRFVHHYLYNFVLVIIKIIIVVVLIIIFLYSINARLELTHSEKPVSV